jgi:hypothetical protein
MPLPKHGIPCKHDAYLSKLRVAVEALTDAREKVEWVGGSYEGYASMMREKKACLYRIDAALAAIGLLP